jgi:hypothetical protein
MKDDPPHMDDAFPNSVPAFFCDCILFSISSLNYGNDAVLLGDLSSPPYRPGGNNALDTETYISCLGKPINQL